MPLRHFACSGFQVWLVFGEMADIDYSTYIIMSLPNNKQIFLMFSDLTSVGCNALLSNALL